MAIKCQWAEIRHLTTHINYFKKRIQKEKKKRREKEKRMHCAEFEDNALSITARQLVFYNWRNFCNFAFRGFRTKLN